MKLRNKKTDIIGELHYEPEKEYHFTVVITEDPSVFEMFKTLEDLAEEWEGYKSVEYPRIMNEKSRNTIRAWAELNGFDKVTYEYDVEFAVSSFVVGYVAIRFFDCFVLLENGKEYTIAELCGEEEKCES